MERDNSYSLLIEERDGYIWVSGLEGSGDPGELRRVIMDLAKVANGRPIRFVVEPGPQMERLVRFYMKFGASPLGILMEAHT